MNKRASYLILQLLQTPHGHLQSGLVRKGPGGVRVKILGGDKEFCTLIYSSIHLNSWGGGMKRGNAAGENLFFSID